PVGGRTRVEHCPRGSKRGHQAVGGGTRRAAAGALHAQPGAHAGRRALPATCAPCAGGSAGRAGRARAGAASHRRRCVAVDSVRPRPQRAHRLARRLPHRAPSGGASGAHRRPAGRHVPAARRCRGALWRARGLVPRGVAAGAGQPPRAVRGAGLLCAPRRAEDAGRSASAQLPVAGPVRHHARPVDLSRRERRRSGARCARHRQPHCRRRRTRAPLGRCGAWHRLQVAAGRLGRSARRPAASRTHRLARRGSAAAFDLHAPPHA
ncbi:hypothetical protein COLO4_00686, partial [Corchorus olitorius]